MSYLPRYFLIILFFPVLLCASTIDEITADTQYEYFMSCLKENKNDISQCLKNVVKYIKSEKVALNTAKSNVNHVKRLMKTIDFLERSTKHLYAKAKKSKDLGVYEKAVNCAKLLTQFGKKYSSYQEVIVAYDRLQKEKVTTILIKSLFKKARAAQFPGMIEAHQTLAEKGRKLYQIISPELATDLTSYGKRILQRHLKHLRGLKKAIEQQKPVKLDTLPAAREIYLAVIKIPGVEAHQKEEKSIRIELESVIIGLQKEVQKRQSNAIKKFLEGALRLNNIIELTKRSEYVIPILVQAVSIEELIVTGPKIDSKSIEQKKMLTRFIATIAEAMENDSKEAYIDAIQVWKKAFDIAGNNIVLATQTKKRLEQGRQAGLTRAFDSSRNAVAKHDYTTALKIIKNAQRLEPTTEEQYLLQVERREIIKTARNYIRDNPTAMILPPQLGTGRFCGLSLSVVTSRCSPSSTFLLNKVKDKQHKCQVGASMYVYTIIGKDLNANNIISHMCIPYASLVKQDDHEYLAICYGMMNISISPTLTLDVSVIAGGIECVVNL